MFHQEIFIIDLNCYRILLLKNKFYKTDPRSEAFYNIFLLLPMESNDLETAGSTYHGGSIYNILI